MLEMENETCVGLMKIEEIINSVFTSKTYILPVGDSNECWLVDCGDVDKVLDMGWKVRGVLLTHVHFDHIYGLNRLREREPSALIYTNAEGKEALQNPRWNFSRYHTDVPDFVLERMENVRVIEGEGRISLLSSTGGSDLAVESVGERSRTTPCFLKDVEALFTPGHEPSCVSYRLGDKLFTGDCYIPGVKVVTTFPRSNKQQAAESLTRLQELERSGLKVMPGHWIENNEKDK